MASDMLKAVLDTEHECSLRETEAKKQAEADKQQAKQRASEMVAAAVRQSEDALTENRKALEKQSETELQKARQDAGAECGKLSANARKNMDRVQKLVVEMLTRV